MTRIIAQRFLNNEIRLRLVCAPSSKAKSSTKLLKQLPEGFCMSNLPAPSLDIIREFQRPPKAAKKGGWGHPTRQTKFNREARHKILEAGAVLDRDFRGSILMLTGTLPGSTQEALRGISEWSGYIVNRLQQWLRRRMPDLWAFYAWELQPKRGALHIHYVVAIPDSQIREFVKDNFKKQWIKILKAVSLKSGIDLFEKEGAGFSWMSEEVIQADALDITKSAAAYISKYVSKEAITKGFDNKKRYYPARWHGMTRCLKREVLAGRDCLGSSRGAYEERLAAFHEICNEINKNTRAAYTMEDRWHPQNRTLIIYQDDEFLTETWEKLQYLLTRTTCLLEARLTLMNQKTATPAWDEIRQNFRMRKRCIAEAEASELFSYVWKQVSERRGNDFDPDYQRTYLELWEIHCENWLPTLRRVCS